MPIPGVTIITSFFPHEVEADLSLRLLELDREAEEAGVPPALRNKIRRDILLNYRNVIQGFSPVKTGRLRRSIRIMHGEGLVRTIVGYAPIVERRRHFFQLGAAVASLFDRIVLERYRMEDLEQRLRGRDLGEFASNYQELKKNLNTARSMVSQRTRGVPPKRAQPFGLGPQLNLNRITNVANSLSGLTRLNFVANQLVFHAKSLGPTAPPAVGGTRLRTREGLPKFMAAIALDALRPQIEPAEAQTLRGLQVLGTGARPRDPDRNQVIEEIRQERQERELQRTLTIERSQVRPSGQRRQRRRRR